MDPDPVSSTTEALQALYISNSQYKSSSIESLCAEIDTEPLVLEILELLGEESEPKREEIIKFFVLNGSAYRFLVKLIIDNNSSSMVSGIKIINWISNSQYIGKISKRNLKEAMRSLVLALDIKGEREEDILVLAVKGLEAILKWGKMNPREDGKNELLIKFEQIEDAVRNLEELQMHVSEKVYHATAETIDNIFAVDDEMY